MTRSQTPPDAGSDKPSLLQRLSLAFGTFFDVLRSADRAAAVAAWRRGEVPDASAPATQAPAPVPALRDTVPDSALQLLALLQREARLIDFAHESLGSYSDAQIGAAARLVHDGCAKVLREHFQIMPVRDEPEGTRVTLPAGFDAASVRLTGQVVGQPPFTGSLNHRGWRVTDVRLPQLAERHDTRVLAPAEVEL
jgi:hypothetical protein